MTSRRPSHLVLTQPKEPCFQCRSQLHSANRCTLSRYACDKIYTICRIKTSLSNLVSCFGQRMRALANVFHRGENRGKIPCQRPNPRRYPFPSFKTHETSAPKSSFPYDRRCHLILPLPPVYTLPALYAHI